MVTQKVLISACLLGENVKYDGGNNFLDHPVVKKWKTLGLVVPVCPEVAGGLTIPRPGAEIVSGYSGKDVISGSGKVMTIESVDVTSKFIKGANVALTLVKQHGIKLAILKARSPSCGNYQIYDGTHSNTKVDGEGVTTALLHQSGVRDFNETELADAEKYWSALL